MFDGIGVPNRGAPQLNQDLLNIRATRARLMDLGWCRGAPKHGHECLGAALIAVYGLSVSWTDRWVELEELPIAGRVHRAVVKVTGRAADSIPTFNDWKATSKKVIFQVLDVVEEGLIDDGATIPQTASAFAEKPHSRFSMRELVAGLAFFFVLLSSNFPQP